MRSLSAAAARRFLLPFLLFQSSHLFFAADAAAQQELRIEPPSKSEDRFLEQVRSLFGQFREGDLNRAFDLAQTIQCSTLTSDNGEWRPVAIVNEDRKLGDSYHRSIDDVKSDPSVYIFKGECSTDQSTVQLVTRFPVEDSMYDYAAGKIRFEAIDVKVNPAVQAFRDPVTQAYRFELPYMYARQSRTGIAYSLAPAYSTDRYAPNVKNRWDCKSVHATDVTFQFLICRTQTLPRDLPPGTRAIPTFGSNAYFILSDGKEASTSVRLSFGGPGIDEPPATPAKP